MPLSKRQRKWMLIVAEILVFVAVYFGIKAYMQRDMAEGEAPALSGELLNGAPVSLDAYRGQPVLVHFWASWCRICRLEQGAIDSIHGDWPVLTIAMQSGDEKEVSAYLEEQGLAWDTIADVDGSLSRAFGVHGVPASFVIDGDGVIRFREMGYTTAWGLRTRLWLAGLEGADRPLSGQPE